MKKLLENLLLEQEDIFKPPTEEELKKARDELERRKADEVKKRMEDLKVAIQRYNENAKKEWNNVVKVVNAFVEVGGDLSVVSNNLDLHDEIDVPAFATAWIYSRLEGKGWDEGTSKRIRKALEYV